MCCRNKYRRSGGCGSRRFNNNNNNTYASSGLPLGGNQAPVIIYERRPGLIRVLARHVAQKRQAKQQQQQYQQQQQALGYQNQTTGVALVDERKVEEERKIMEERQAMTTWNENRDVDVHHVQGQDFEGGNGYKRYSTMSAGTELPSYGQAVKQ